MERGEVTLAGIAIVPPSGGHALRGVLTFRDKDGREHTASYTFGPFKEAIEQIDQTEDDAVFFAGLRTLGIREVHSKPGYYRLLMDDRYVGLLGTLYASSAALNHLVLTLNDSGIIRHELYEALKKRRPVVISNPYG